MTTRIHADSITEGIRLRTIQLKIMNAMVEYECTDDQGLFDGFDSRDEDQKFLRKILKDKEISEFIKEYYKDNKTTKIERMSAIDICGQFLSEGIGI